MQILDKKLNRISRANLGVFEANLLASLPNLQRILNFLSLRNLLSNELFYIQFSPNNLSSIIATAALTDR
ncbi:riboflavin synthase subunit alpha [Fusobacterium nucleatum YWH7054]|nr:riboflavin synthase subunit alpha [Fusobacterium nucleatum YWH7054]CDA07062.1 putative uncharacterized protein [Fusobacterium sp. CAG:649]